MRPALRALPLALLGLTSAAVSAERSPETMQTIQAATDLLAAVKCRRAGFPYLLRVDADHVICLRSSVAAPQNVERVRDVLETAVRAMRGRR